jgi:hypothetical protein
MEEPKMTNKNDFEFFDPWTEERKREYFSLHADEYEFNEDLGINIRKGEDVENIKQLLFNCESYMRLYTLRSSKRDR